MKNAQKVAILEEATGDEWLRKNQSNETPFSN
jgi:hypothetical protein